MKPSKNHPGVSLYRRGTAIYAEFAEPGAERRTKVSLSKHGIQTMTEAKAWAVVKSRQIREARLSAIMHGVHPQSAIPVVEMIEAYRKTKVADLGVDQAQRMFDWHLRPRLQWISGLGTGNRIGLLTLD